MVSSRRNCSVFALNWSLIFEELPGHLSHKQLVSHTIPRKWPGNAQGGPKSALFSIWSQCKIRGIFWTTMFISASVFAVFMQTSVKLLIQLQGSYCFPDKNMQSVLTKVFHLTPKQKTPEIDTEQEMPTYIMILKIPKSKLKFMGKVNVQGHMIGPISYPLTPLSFHVYRPCHHHSAPPGEGNWS